VRPICEIKLALLEPKNKYSATTFKFQENCENFFPGSYQILRFLSKLTSCHARSLMTKALAIWVEALENYTWLETQGGRGKLAAFSDAPLKSTIYQ
jgi:hypothetical protein